VHAGGDHHAHLGRAHQAVAVEVPALACEQGAPGCAEAGEGAGGGAGTEAHCALGRQTEALQHPACGGLLDAVGGGGVVEGGRALVPGQHQALGSGGGRQGGADDEAEVATTIGGCGSGGAQLVQLPQHLFGRTPLLRQRFFEAGQCGDGVGRGEDAPAGDAIEVGEGAAVGVFEELAFGVHGGLGVGRGPP